MVGIDDPRLPQRFWDKVVPEPTTGCWLWVASTGGSGYGQFYWAPRIQGPHRVVYSVLVGDIPLGMELDHLCRTPLCVNPQHLQVVTPEENKRRSGSGPTCRRGHERNAVNTLIDPRGNKRCRVCHRNNARERRANAR